MLPISVIHHHHNRPSCGRAIAAISFMDSITDTAQVSAMGIRVVPENGQASYRVDLSVPAGTEMILMIGGLFRNAGGAPQAVIISTTTSGASPSLEYLWQVGWGKGITVGLGVVIPEPATVTLAAIAEMMGSFRRRRPTQSE